MRSDYMRGDKDEAVVAPFQWLQAIWLHDRSTSSFSQEVIQFCEASLSAFYRLCGGVNPARADVFTCPHLACLHQLKLLLKARLLLLAPGNEPIRGTHDTFPLGTDYCKGLRGTSSRPSTGLSCVGRVTLHRPGRKQGRERSSAALAAIRAV